MHRGPLDESWLELSYDRFPRLEEAFHAMLDESLRPRGPELLYDLVAGLAPRPSSVAIDVGCGEGRHTLELASRFGLSVTGVDPVARHLELARASLLLRPELRGRVRFEAGSAESLRFASRSVELVWCRDVLVHVAELGRAYSEFERVLAEGGHIVVYQMFGTERLEPSEASYIWRTMGVVPASAEFATTDAAIAAAGLRVVDRTEIGSEWWELAEEESGKPGQRLLYAARLLRDRRRYVERFGEPAYELMLGDCLWHVYAMIGKLTRRADVLSRA